MKIMNNFDKNINDAVSFVGYMLNLIVTAVVDVLVDTAGTISCLFRRFA
jgi:hypothetical protein